jgi:hypothetical protein
MQGRSHRSGAVATTETTAARQAGIRATRRKTFDCATPSAQDLAQ